LKREERKGRKGKPGKRRRRTEEEEIVFDSGFLRSDLAPQPLWAATGLRATLDGPVVH
jgi:hypothetical protein